MKKDFQWKAKHDPGHPDSCCGRKPVSWAGVQLGMYYRHGILGGYQEWAHQSSQIDGTGHVHLEELALAATVLYQMIGQHLNFPYQGVPTMGVPYMAHQRSVYCDMSPSEAIYITAPD